MKRDLLLCYAPKQPATSITNFTTPLPRHVLVDSWGHSLQLIDTSTTFWIFLQNPNGLSLTYRPDANRRISCPSTNQVGQQLSYFQWVSRLIDKGEDRVGLSRWYVTLHGKGDRKVTFVTAYNASYTSGETTNFCQQQLVLTTLQQQHKQSLSATPRRQFMLDLLSWLAHHIQAQHDIILAMDANCTYNPDIPGTAHPLQYTQGVPNMDKQHDGSLSTLIAKFGLTDPLARQHCSCPFPPSHC
jgi:hypothetical protein